MASVRLENFKCFPEFSFAIKRMNILAGINGGGKSSLIQAVLLLKQTVLNNDIACLNGDLVELGSEDDITCFFSDGFCKVEFSVPRGRYGVQHTEGGWQTTVGGDRQNAVRFLNRVDYISADRFGPRLHSPVPDRDDSKSVGKYGEFTASVLARHSDRRVLRALKPPAVGLSSNVLEQVSAWMSMISPGVRVEAQEVEAIRAAYHSVSFEYEDDRTPNFKPNMVGFGISYALPIVVAVLCAPTQTTLLIENPEAHLHPAGQSALGRFLARAAATDLRIVVETHSDHFLNGVRLEIKEKTLRSASAQVYYFSKDDLGHSQAEKLIIESDGTIEEWPPGFFDQGIHDLLALG